MALTNAERQAQWRARGNTLAKLALKHKLADGRGSPSLRAPPPRGLLDGTPTKIAEAIVGKLGAARTRAVVKVLEKRLRNHLPHAAAARENEASIRAAWRAEGRSLADYRAGFKDPSSAVWDWRRARAKAWEAANRAAWLRDHPGDPLPEHLCELKGAEAREYDRWQKEVAWRASKRSSG
jgi:hypothetical protein